MAAPAQGRTAGTAADDAIAAAAAQLMGVYGYLTQLAEAYPEVLADPGYVSAMAALKELAALAAGAGGEPGAIAAAAIAQLEALTGWAGVTSADLRRPS